MKVTNSLNYDSLTFESSYINSNTSGFDLKIIKNCGTESTINLDAFVSNIVSNTITFTSTVLFSSSTIPDGVYNLTLSSYATVPSSSNHTEQYCMYIGTTSRCKALELYNSTTDLQLKTKLQLILFALDNINLCDSCSCSKMCDLYNELLFILNQSTTVTSNVHTDCGC